MYIKLFGFENYKFQPVSNFGINSRSDIAVTQIVKKVKNLVCVLYNQKATFQDREPKHFSIFFLN